MGESCGKVAAALKGKIGRKKVNVNLRIVFYIIIIFIFGIDIFSRCIYCPLVSINTADGVCLICY